MLPIEPGRLRNPGRNEEHVGISPSEYLLRELRRRRKAAGLTQIELGKKTFCSDTVISGIETGTKPVTVEHLELVDTALETGGYFVTLWEEMVKDDAAPVWFREWIEIERAARALRWYEPAFVPGLLQTEAYARATLTGERLTADAADQLVRTRIDRQSILHGDLPPLFVAVLDESILYRSAYGNRPLMAEQLLHLETCAALPHVQIHIIPTAVGMHPGLAGAFILADLVDGSAAAHADNQLAARIVGSAVEVATLAGRWERLRGITLPVDQSLELIKKAAASWT
ncbi:helix-turn-helix transcriptional regulator [Micromonospora sp. NPDC049523]|uniref:helix-turn-helix domain-containing protein n=1 Tax=Micromonospora sp. NPDC049523 TaxID=3155921 RepID=UPI003431A1FB